MSVKHLIVISTIVLFEIINCDKPDICYGSPVTAIERVVFRDDVERYFVASGQYYWFVNQTDDLPTSESAQQLPYGFEPDVALTRDTDGCPGGLYSLLLIQRKHIKGTNEEEWLTMDYAIGRWGENGTDSGQWDEPVRIARCSLDSKVCSTSDNYFATMNFNFKRPLDAAFGVIGREAFFIQDSMIYNVSYKTRCVERPYSEVVAQPPKPFKTRVSAGVLIGDQIFLFDREFYNNVSDAINMTDDDLTDDKWIQGPSNFFIQCPQLSATFSSFLYDIFTDSRSRTMTATVLTAIVIAIIIIIIAVLSLIIWMSLRRKTMRITNNGDNVDASSDSPLHEEHLLKNSDSPKDVAKDSSNKDTNQVRLPLQTSC